MQTYQIVNNGEAILCLCCGKTSYNINDVVNKYCSYCHEFHDDNATYYGEPLWLKAAKWATITKEIERLHHLLLRKNN